MGKSKAKAKKESSVFRVAGAKVAKGKNKAKPVTTNLKKMNIAGKTKTEKADAAFKHVQKEVMAAAKNRAKKPTSQTTKKAKNAPTQKPVTSAADVDSTMEDFSKL